MSAITGRGRGVRGVRRLGDVPRRDAPPGPVTVSGGRPVVVTCDAAGCAERLKAVRLQVVRDAGWRVTADQRQVFCPRH